MGTFVTRLMFRIGAVCLLPLLASCATTMSKGSQCTVDPGYLDAESAYTWYAETAVDVDDDTGFVSPIIVQQLQEAVEDQLSSKGFAYVDPIDSDSIRADVQVRIALRTRRELMAMTIDDVPCAHVDCWERIDTSDHTRFDMRTMGFLTADVYHFGKPIWRGWVERPLYPEDRDKAVEVIRAAVPALFESFPP